MSEVRKNSEFVSLKEFLAKCSHLKAATEAGVALTGRRLSSSFDTSIIIAHFRGVVEGAVCSVTRSATTTPSWEALLSVIDYSLFFLFFF